MGIIGKIRHKAAAFYRDRLVKAQYPMLTIISRKQQEKNGAIGLVYMLHHIIEKNPHGIPTNEDLKVSPTFLEGIILKYKKQGFDFISIDQLNKIIKSNKKPERPFIAFTIDDGYLVSVHLRQQFRSRQTCHTLSRSRTDQIPVRISHHRPTRLLPHLRRHVGSSLHPALLPLPIAEEDDEVGACRSLLF